ncbi:MAG: S-layer homology domain-containing protein [Clostridia bacterium]|nr:S-layer homology domain-containing protein [Clostridia bacterium]
MTVSGGSFTVDPSAYAAADYIVKVTDNGYSVAEEKDLGRGTYTSDPSDSLASGYYAVNNGDGTWTVYKKSSDPTSRGDYKITVKNAKNGDVDVNVDYADKGDKVTITVDPDKGYVLESLTVTDKDGDEIDLTKKSDTKYTFTMPKSKVTVTAVFVAEDAAIKLPFVDVAEGDACYDAVAFVYANGLMVGVGDGTKFAPEMTLSRAMTAQIFHNLEKNPAAAASTFTDVARNFWYTDAIDWATAQGVISGDGKGNFMPSTDVTREQLAVMLYQYAQSKGYNVAVGSALTQPDAANVSFWATDAMTWAVNNGILVENGVGYLAATDVATRADVAEAFMAFVNLYA